MRSPFPGMNPYLEQPAVWQDFHQSLVTRIRDALAGQVRPQFFVRIEESIFIHEPDGAERRKRIGRPDIAILANPDPRTDTVIDQKSNQVAALIGTIADMDVERHSYIEIRDREHRDLVTMIEALSPSNKQYRADREQYLMKRTSLLYSHASVVEIDLLRKGPWLPLSGIPVCDYLLMVSRPEMRPEVQFWPVALRDPLPVIPIPLRDAIPDATLDLQSLLHEVYDAAGYEDYLYESLPESPLSEADSAWVNQVIAGVS
jgi:hypothetical protein